MNDLKLIYTTDIPLEHSKVTGSSLVSVTIDGQQKEYYVINMRSEVVRTEWTWGYSSNDYKTIYTYEMIEFKKVKIKTKEQIAAEESVTKAKEALKAAENALKVVKEKKK